MTWGEFLDTEWYRETAVARLLPEPWRFRRLATPAHLFERSFLWRIAQDDRIRQVSRDAERIAALRGSLEREGLKEPLQIALDVQGRLALRDGHHRLIASEDLHGFDLMPACFVRSQGIGARAQSVVDVIDQLLAIRQ